MLKRQHMRCIMLALALALASCGQREGEGSLAQPGERAGEAGGSPTPSVASGAERPALTSSIQTEPSSLNGQPTPGATSRPALTAEASPAIPTATASSSAKPASEPQPSLTARLATPTSTYRPDPASPSTIIFESSYPPPLPPNRFGLAKLPPPAWWQGVQLRSLRNAEGIEVGMQLELPEGEGQPARRLDLTTAHRGYQQPPHTITLSVEQAGSWREAQRFELGEIRTISMLEPALLEPGRLWFVLHGNSGPATCALLLSLHEATIEEHYATCQRTIDAELYDLDGDGDGELILTSRPFAGPSYLVAEIDIYAYDWSPDGQLSEIWLMPASDERLPQPVRDQLSQTVDLAHAGLWQEAQALVEALPPQQLRGGDGQLLANLILLNAEKRRQRLLIEGAEGSDGDRLLLTLAYGDYAGALELLRGYEPPQLLETERNMLIITRNGEDVEWDEPELAIIARSDLLRDAPPPALRLKPELAAAYFIRGMGMALDDALPVEVLADLRRAAELDPAEPLFQAALRYWQGRTP